MQGCNGRITNSPDGIDGMHKIQIENDRNNGKRTKIQITNNKNQSSARSLASYICSSVSYWDVCMLCAGMDAGMLGCWDALI